MLSLSPEILSKIASFLLPHRHTLYSLLLTSKSLHTASEPYLYASLILPTPALCLSVCTSLTLSPRLATHVRRFIYAPEARYARVPATAQQAFWGTLQRALEGMEGLDVLVLSDLTFDHSWIFGSPNLPKRIRELRIRTAWDEHTIAFVSRQQELHLLQFYDAIDSPTTASAVAAAADPLLGSESESTPTSMPIRLPHLETLESMLSIALQFLPGCSKLRHVQLVVDCEGSAAVGAMIGKLVVGTKPLRALSLMDLSEDMSNVVLSMVGQCVPELKHMGLLVYPMTSRHLFHKHLLTLHHLQVLELDLSRWAPLPTPTAAQRVLADELRVYCPSLRVIVFWINGTRTRWIVNDNNNHNSNGNQNQDHTQILNQRNNNQNQNYNHNGNGNRNKNNNHPTNGNATGNGLGYGQWQSRTEQGLYPPLADLWRSI